MRKLTHTIVVATTIFALTACGGSSGSGPEAGGDSGSSENYPNSQIKMVIPYSPGGATDVIFRTYLPYVEEELGQTIVPVNMPGATSTIGSREVKNAEPDGYTILASHDVLITAELSGVVDYSFDAFEPVALLTQTPNIATVSAQTNWSNAEEFAQYVKNNPGEVTWGMTPGSTSHFFVQTMADKMGITTGEELKLITYEGTGPAITGVQAGDIDGTMTNYTSAKSQFDSGTFEPIGVAWDERLKEMPDAATFEEQGIDMVNATSRGIFAPEGTPKGIVTKLEEAFRTATENPELQEKLQNFGTLVNFMPSGEYVEFLNDQEQALSKTAKNMDF